MVRTLFASATAFLFVWLSCNGEPWQGKEPGNILVCYGKTATLVWDCLPSQTLGSINQIDWSYKTKNEVIMSYISTIGLTKSSKYENRSGYAEFLGNGALTIENISENDIGIYKISLSGETSTYISENAILTGISVENATTCFADFSMTINGKTVKVSNGTTNIVVDSGSRLIVDLKIPDGCNNEAVCTYNEKSCGLCHLDTECKFSIENVEAGQIINISVTPCQGVEYIYLIPVSGSSTPTSLQPKGSSTPTSLPPTGSSTPTSLLPKGSSSLATPKGLGIILCFFAYLSC